MKTNQPHFSFFYKTIAIVLLVFSLLITGCAKKTIVTTEVPTEILDIETPSQLVPVTSYGRYTLVEVGLAPERRNLLNQIIDVTIPTLTAKQRTSVLDALHYVLLNSGYKLCENDTVKGFKYFDLPLAHRQLGPASLKEILSVLVGPSWQMQVDHTNRQICFSNNQELAEEKTNDLSTQ